MTSAIGKSLMVVKSEEESTSPQQTRVVLRDGNVMLLEPEALRNCELVNVLRKADPDLGHVLPLGFLNGYQIQKVRQWNKFFGSAHTEADKELFLKKFTPKSERLRFRILAGATYLSHHELADYMSVRFGETMVVKGKPYRTPIDYAHIWRASFPRDSNRDWLVSSERDEDNDEDNDEDIR